MKTAKEILTKDSLHKTYWGKVIIKAEREDGFLEEDWAKSEDWTTCACGKQDKRIERNQDGAPKDLILYELGVHFSDFVASNDFYVSAYTLIKIEKRAAKLLQEVKGK